MKLANCQPRTRVRLVGVRVGPEFLLRLQELGLRQGAEFSVVSRAAFGGMVVNVAGTRVAVDKGSAQALEVDRVLRAVLTARRGRSALRLGGQPMGPRPRQFF